MAVDFRADGLEIKLQKNDKIFQNLFSLIDNIDSLSTMKCQTGVSRATKQKNE